MSRACISPDEAAIERLEGARDQKAEASKICIVEMIQQLREVKGVAGVHVMAYRQEEYVSEIVHEFGVLDGRSPWRRDFVSKMQAVESLAGERRRVLRFRRSPDQDLTGTDVAADSMRRRLSRRSGRALLRERRGRRGRRARGRANE